MGCLAFVCSIKTEHPWFSPVVMSLGSKLSGQEASPGSRKQSLIFSLLTSLCFVTHLACITSIRFGEEVVSYWNGIVSWVRARPYRMWAKQERELELLINAPGVKWSLIRFQNKLCSVFLLKLLGKSYGYWQNVNTLNKNINATCNNFKDYSSNKDICQLK